jgi:hypothetical protein
MLFRAGKQGRLAIRWQRIATPDGLSVRSPQREKLKISPFKGVFVKMYTLAIADIYDRRCILRAYRVASEIERAIVLRVSIFAKVYDIAVPGTRVGLMDFVLYKISVAVHYIGIPLAIHQVKFTVGRVMHITMLNTRDMCTALDIVARH